VTTKTEHSGSDYRQYAIEDQEAGAWSDEREPLGEPQWPSVGLEGDRGHARPGGQPHRDVELLGEVDVEIEQVLVGPGVNCRVRPGPPAYAHRVTVLGPHLDINPQLTGAKSSPGESAPSARVYAAAAGPETP